MTAERQEYVTQLTDIEKLEQNKISSTKESINTELLNIMWVEDNSEVAREYVSISNMTKESLTNLVDQNDLLPEERPLKEELGSGMLFAQVEYLMNNKVA